MLQSAVAGATKTRLMYDAFLSHSQVEEYLGFLLSKRLISIAADKKHYFPTEKGLRFLSMYGKIKDAVALDSAQSIPPKEQPAPPLETQTINEVAQPPSSGRKVSP